MYSSQAKILGVAEELVASNEIRVKAEDFNSQGIDPLRTKRASEAWLFLTTTCKGTALEIVHSTDSPSAAWRELLQRHRACDLKEKSRLMQEVHHEGGSRRQVAATSWESRRGGRQELVILNRLK